MILKLFTKPDCPKCPAAKALVRQLIVNSKQLIVEKYDISTPEGLAEASFYSVMGTPGLILCDGNGKEVSGWRGEVPSEKEIKKLIANS